MDLSDVRNSRLPNRIDKSLFNEEFDDKLTEIESDLEVPENMDLSNLIDDFNTESDEDFNDYSKSARHRSSFNMPNFPDNRRTKTSLSEKDLLFNDIREDSLNFFYQKQTQQKKPNQKPEKSIIPCVVVRRKQEDKQKNPDRISLDRQNLTSCPILENEENLRLLNYQYNYINQIQHLDKLRKLILLDLYDNRIERISGLETLKSLRVLMLGRNRISKIEGLESLNRLDVLDLHANSIQVIENINHLSDLRVLNLAGNVITCLTNLRGLYSLSEVNIRRNCVESVIDINPTNCPNLQRIFLSFNHLGRISDFSCLIDLGSLNELSIDNNPISSNGSSRSAVIFNFPQLNLLDTKQITEDDRNKAKQIINRLELGSKSNSGLSRHIQGNNSRTSNSSLQSNHIQRFHSLKERQKGSLNNSQRIFEGWNQNGRNISPRLSIKCFSSSSNSLYGTELQNSVNSLNDNDTDSTAKSIRANKSMQDFNSNMPKEFMAIEETISKPSNNHSYLLSQQQNSHNKPDIELSQSSKHPSSSSPFSSNVEVSNSSVSSQKGTVDSNETESVISNTISSESKVLTRNPIEIVNENELMQFYSLSALGIFEDKEFWAVKPALSTSVTILVFQEIEFIEIEKNFHQIKARFPNIKKIAFQGCDIKCYSQINSLANLKRLEELVIEKLNNPISSFTLIRYYVVFRLAHLGLRKFNDEEITDHEYLTARRYFLNLATMSPNQILQLHLIGTINDIRKRELLRSTENEQVIPMTVHNANFAQVPSVNLDLVGRSGILTNFTPDPDAISEKKLKKLSLAMMREVLDNVRKRRDWEERFHSQWELAIWQFIHSRVTPITLHRHNFMKQQFDKILFKSNNINSIPSSTKIKNNN